MMQTLNDIALTLYTTLKMILSNPYTVLFGIAIIVSLIGFAIRILRGIKHLFVHI